MTSLSSKRSGLPARSLLPSASVLVAAAVAMPSSSAAVRKDLVPRFVNATAFDASPPLSELAKSAALRPASLDASRRVREIRPERGPRVKDNGFAGDGALQRRSRRAGPQLLAIPAPQLTFEGLSNQDNFNVIGGRVNPPDPVGDVGPNHYVEMINLVFAVYSKTGAVLLGPVDLGALWAGFAVEDCTDLSGDGI